MNQEEYNQVMNMQAKLAQSESNVAKMQQALTLFQDKDENNLVKFQLDIEKELVRIERLLRKQVVQKDPKGNEFYVDPPKEEQLLNDYGINETMNLLAWYVNKDIILSFYEPEQINKIMEQFGEEVIDFFYTNMEKFGIDTIDKKKHYPLMVMNIINIVDATYRRALWGKQLELISKSYVVSQNDSLGKMNFYPQVKSSGMLGKLKSVFKP